MNNQPIGIFDSGLGGLTCVKEVMKLLPNEDIIYFGDTSRVPYGTRSSDTIIKYVRQDINFLKTFDIKMIIIACGTASSTALSAVYNDYDIPIMGVVEPASVDAVSLTKNGKIGVLGTTGTINSGKYSEFICELNPTIEVVSQSCPLFVPLVENGYLNGEIPTLIAREYLKPLIDAEVDTIILGCTHYPLLSDVIYNIVGRDINLVNPGQRAAIYAAETLAYCGANTSGKPGTARYFVSDSVEGFSTLGGMFLEREITDNVRKIDIEKY